MATPPPNPPQETPPTSDWNDRFAFQVWQVMFLLVLCMAFANYLVSMFRGGA